MFDAFIEQFPRFMTWENGAFLFRAAVVTMEITIIGIGLGFVFGFVLVYLRLTPGWLFWPVRVLMISYTEFFRRVPFLVLLFLVLFISKGLGFNFSLFAVACISIVILSTAFLSEILRAGLESVHHNQWDAASVMNFSRLQTFRYVVVPQAWRVILPPAFAFFVVFVKDSSVASQVGVLELTQAGKHFNNIGYSAIFSFGTIMVIYFILSYPLTRLGWWMEARLRRSRLGEGRVQPVETILVGRPGGVGLG